MEIRHCVKSLTSGGRKTYVQIAILRVIQGKMFSFIGPQFSSLSNGSISFLID